MSGADTKTPRGPGHETSPRPVFGEMVDGVRGPFWPEPGRPRLDLEVLPSPATSIADHDRQRTRLHLLSGRGAGGVWSGERRDRLSADPRRAADAEADASADLVPGHRQRGSLDPDARCGHEATGSDDRAKRYA